MESMFKYVVVCGDYNLGGYEYNETYSGTDRNKAIAAYKEAKDWMGMVDVTITVLGRENSKTQKKHIWDTDDNIDYDVPDIIECKDGTFAFDYLTDPCDMDNFIAEHGAVVNTYSYEEYCHGVGVFANDIMPVRI